MEGSKVPPPPNYRSNTSNCFMLNCSVCCAQNLLVNWRAGRLRPHSSHQPGYPMGRPSGTRSSPNNRTWRRYLHTSKSRPTDAQIHIRRVSIDRSPSDFPQWRCDVAHTLIPPPQTASRDRSRRAAYMCSRRLQPSAPHRRSSWRQGPSYFSTRL